MPRPHVRPPARRRRGARGFRGSQGAHVRPLRRRAARSGARPARCSAMASVVRRPEMVRVAQWPSGASCSATWTSSRPRNRTAKRERGGRVGHDGGRRRPPVRPNSPIRPGPSAQSRDRQGRAPQRRAGWPPERATASTRRSGVACNAPEQPNGQTQRRGEALPRFVRQRMSHGGTGVDEARQITRRVVHLRPGLGQHDVEFAPRVARRAGGRAGGSRVGAEASCCAAASVETPRRR
jgi:hypothetical protein